MTAENVEEKLDRHVQARYGIVSVKW